MCSLFLNEVGCMSACVLDEMIILGRENGRKISESQNRYK
jgi:hypothetical protein